jgi:hypothetical protein
VIPVDVLRKAMHEISSKKGDFTLFALFRRADALGMWDLVVSAPWLERGKFKALGQFVDLLAKSIGRESLRQFSRVETVPSNNRTLKYILANIPVDDEERRIQSTELFDLQIEEAIILRSKRPETERPGVQGASTRGRRNVA